MASTFEKVHEYPHEKRLASPSATYVPRDGLLGSTDGKPPFQEENVPDQLVEKYTARNSQLKRRTLFWALRYFAVVILVAGLLVWWLGSNWPDLLVGFLTAIIAIKGGVEILRDARKEARQAKEVSR